MIYRSVPNADAPCNACWLPLEVITPRLSLHDAQEGGSLRALMADIRARGLQRPVLVRPQGSGRYVIVSGNRRLLACRHLGMTHIEATVLPEMPPPTAAALLEAVRSHRLHYLDEADLLRQLNERHGLTREEIARAVGSTACDVTMRMQLTDLSDPLRAFLMEEGAPERIAWALLRLPDATRRMEVARRAARERLCIRDVEALITARLTREPMGAVPEAPAQPGSLTMPVPLTPPVPLTMPVPLAPGAAATRRPRTGRVMTLMRDARPYINAIRDIAGQLRAAGCPVVLTEKNSGGQLELTVRLVSPGRERRRRALRHQSR